MVIRCLYYPRADERLRNKTDPLQEEERCLQVYYGVDSETRVPGVGDRARGERSWLLGVMDDVVWVSSV